MVEGIFLHDLTSSNLITLLEIELFDGGGLHLLIILFVDFCTWIEALEGALVDYFTLSSCLEPCALVRRWISTHIEDIPLYLTSNTFGGGC